MNKKLKQFTLKECKTEAVNLAMYMKTVARSLEMDAKDYDVKFPLTYATNLSIKADEFLKRI